MRCLGKIAVGLSAFVIIMSSCAAPRPQSTPGSTPVVPLSAVIGSLKCGLAKAIFKDVGGRTGLLAGVAKVELKVNVVEGRTLDGGIGVGIPVATAGTFTPSFSFKVDAKTTNNSTIKFNIDMSAANLAVCDAPYAVGHDSGFSGWIGDVVENLNNTVSGSPKVSMQSYEYDTDFTLVRTGGGKLGFEIKPVTGNLSYDASRTDVQHINIKIDAVHVVGGRTRYQGGKPFNVIPGTPQEYRRNPERKPSVTVGRCKIQEGGQVRPGGIPFMLAEEC